MLLEFFILEMYFIKHNDVISVFQKYFKNEQATFVSRYLRESQLTALGGVQCSYSVL